MSSLRVLVLTTSFPLASQAYSGIFVRRMLENLPLDIHVTVIVPAAKTDAVLPVESDISVHPFQYAPKRLQILAHEPGGIPVTLRTKPWTYALLPMFLCSMLASCFRHARLADVIHANWSICGCIAGIVGKIRRIPVITTLRGEDVTRAHRHVIDRAILGLSMKLSNRIIAVSPSIESWLQQRYPRLAHKVRTIENGIEDKLLSIPRHLSDPTTKKPVSLLTVGSLIPRKGVNCIIEAIGHLRDSKRVFLSVVGAGSERAPLERLAEQLGVDQDVEFIGAVEPEAVADMLAWADIFVLASHSEGRPNVILEAMAAGLPVIATNIDGIRGLVEHGKTGLLYDVNNSRQLAEHISYLLDNENVRLAMGEQARRWIIQRRLLWSVTSQHYDELYRSVARKIVSIKDS